MDLYHGYPMKEVSPSDIILFICKFLKVTIDVFGCDGSGYDIFSTVMLGLIDIFYCWFF